MSQQVQGPGIEESVPTVCISRGAKVNKASNTPHTSSTTMASAVGDASTGSKAALEQAVLDALKAGKPITDSLAWASSQSVRALSPTLRLCV